MYSIVKNNGNSAQKFCVLHKSAYLVGTKIQDTISCVLDFFNVSEVKRAFYSVSALRKMLEKPPWNPCRDREISPCNPLPFWVY